jgi:ABC-type multidrug transport system fused ATPase/permease subunit
VIENVVGSDLSIALRNGVQLIGGMILLVIENAYLTGLMLLVVPPLTVGVVAFGRVIRKMSRAVQDRLAETSAQIQESLGGIQTVQAFVREEREAQVYGGGVEAAFLQALALARWRAWFFSVTSVAGYAAVVFIIWMGGREVIAGNLSPGDLAAFMLYTLIVATALANVASLWGSLQRASGATERLFAIIDTVPDIRDPDEPLPMPEGAGAVEFDEVCFTYPSRPDQPVLDRVSFSVAPGEAVAIVGPSGAGKTTLTALLFRFFDVDSGRVAIDGADVRDVRLEDLRRSMAIVSQEPILFSGSIRENIAYGRPEATADEIESAARSANAHDFVESFPDGYETPCGERGVKLSGGQKQRIAIARAILADPRLLILDEATSNLDSESEAAVQAALAELMHQRTTLVIAHRLSTVRDADRIVVLDHGKLVEQGDHEALLAAAGLYARLVERQLS